MALSIATASCHGGNDQDTQTAAGTPNPAVENIMTRASVRAYTEAEVTDTQIDTMLKAAMAAPTAVNKQPWAFVVVKSPETLKTIADSIPSMSMAKSAPVAIIVCGDMTRALTGEGHGYWIQDVSAATENLLLAAHAQGLGAVWCGVYPASQRVTFISNLLDLPDDIIPLAVVPVGYPRTAAEPKEKWDTTKIHYEKW